MMSSVAIAENLFTLDGPPALIGGRHKKTGKITFPLPQASADHEPVVLPRQGKLWSWTVQRFRPKSPPYAGPEEFEPFAVGYVELKDAVIVEARLTGVAFDAIKIGMALETVLLPFGTDDEGRTVLTYAFAPAKEVAA